MHALQAARQSADNRYLKIPKESYKHLQTLQSLYKMYINSVNNQTLYSSQFIISSVSHQSTSNPHLCKSEVPLQQLQLEDQEAVLVQRDVPPECTSAGSAAECGQKRPKESYRHLQTLQSLYKMQMLPKNQTLYSSHLYPTNPLPTHMYAKVRCLCSNFSWRIRKLCWFNGMCLLSARVAGSPGRVRTKET